MVGVGGEVARHAGGGWGEVRADRERGGVLPVAVYEGVGAAHDQRIHAVLQHRQRQPGPTWLGLEWGG